MMIAENLFKFEIVGHDWVGYFQLIAHGCNDKLIKISYWNCIWDKYLKIYSFLE
jgi:hypothetical protein